MKLHRRKRRGIKPKLRNKKRPEVAPSGLSQAIPANTQTDKEAETCLYYSHDARLFARAGIMDEVFLLEITCRWCGQSFFICQSCWRGQGYCSDACRVFGYRKNRQKRQRKYRNSPKGRKTHRKNENRRKNRQTKKKVGDATTNILPPLISCSQKLYSDTPCCHCCGKKGIIVTQFPRRRYGSRYYADFGGQILAPGTS